MDILLAIYNMDLANLSNGCVSSLVSAVAVIIKIALDPESYRTIGLECVSIKWIKYLYHEETYEWAEKHDVLTPVQNGFLSG